MARRNKVVMKDKRKKNIYKMALEVAERENCYFIDQLVSFLPISMSTFYEYFPATSEEMEDIKRVIDKNRIATKTKMYKKWFESDNATLQIGLMKLIASEEEAHRLNGTNMKVESNNTTTIIDLGSGKAPKDNNK